MTIEVWQKVPFEDERSIPPLEASLIYQVSPDKHKVYCQITFSTPYPVAKVCLKDGIKATRFGDKVVCYYEVQDGHFRTLRIDHPEQPIYGCATAYDSGNVPYFISTLNMNIQVREGHIPMLESGDFKIIDGRHRYQVARKREDEK